MVKHVIIFEFLKDKDLHLILFLSFLWYILYVAYGHYYNTKMGEGYTRSSGSRLLHSLTIS